MRLKILSLKGAEYDGEIKGLNVKTGAGEITVLDRHLPIIADLKKGTAIIFETEGKKEIKISGGFLEMSRDNVLTLLVD
ncbi:hypothetical protein A2W54_01745 [Candidatus Giovannonibacteria bacterium RIFCSPHIGHO2_02_43_13]|uniref:ATP synthase F1 complex delta/epsilon subunit N-terminal domain-containing protein n=1 Tax=Candidatus Giovannonibacteria bacterium RIFCSPHIGHO2_02_43_13 TaxID=1798330 RepID=A0A1F5WUX6_9BACT|nr:MAG: ATP synthase, delta/epsilon subunit, beta-sandwich domain protein [Parcubacteria group bacterium GW2011_GWA2_44_13]OGF73203.1 MAG: hypothetical protein A3E06_03770 [Candidatus Giovannonibacteria bacterium RIFCSPHIGHO2_12_FULL_44_42]OGF79450.1 MAG: hypothetical protein A2W54_01745 [Candidatus Giovannonibacteria bacterium RIFCSPHIGHO2_02_43_13]OGF89312.1 MAG: hypothetical protein A3I94_01800 [Candidatus Giovannonibacteria bacterium RIFCSPLOWO2_02_FULL_43_54]OGF97484.1 MAG: hypothetical pr